MPAFLVRSQDIRLHGTIFGSIFVCLSTALLRRTSIPLGNCALMDSAAFLTNRIEIDDIAVNRRLLCLRNLLFDDSKTKLQ